MPNWGVVREGSRRPFKLLIIMLTVMAVAGATMARAVSSSECKEEVKLLENLCRPVAFGSLPTADCCARVRVAHTECVCPFITPTLARLIDIRKAVKIIEGCGRKVPPHYKCGSITTPP